MVRIEMALITSVERFIVTMPYQHMALSPTGGRHTWRIWWWKVCGKKKVNCMTIPSKTAGTAFVMWDYDYL